MVRCRIREVPAVGPQVAVGYDPQQEIKGISSHAKNLSVVSKAVHSEDFIGWRTFQGLQNVSLLPVREHFRYRRQDVRCTTNEKIGAPVVGGSQPQSQKAATSLRLTSNY
jgi:hypothetical protein